MALGTGSGLTDSSVNPKKLWHYVWLLIICLVIFVLAVGIAAGTASAADVVWSTTNETEDAPTVVENDTSSITEESENEEMTMTSGTDEIDWVAVSDDEVRDDETILFQVEGTTDGHDVCIRKDGDMTSVECVDADGDFNEIIELDVDDLGLDPGESELFFGAIRSCGLTGCTTHDTTASSIDIKYPEVDASVESVSADRSKVPHGEIVKFDVEIKNTGGPTETFHYAGEVYDDDSYQLDDGTVEIKPGNTEEVGFEWTVDDDAELTSYHLHTEVSTATVFGNADEYLDGHTQSLLFDVCGPELDVSPTALDLEEYEYGNPPSDSIDVENAGCGDLEWEAQDVQGILDIEERPNSVDVTPDDSIAGELDPASVRILATNDHVEGDEIKTVSVDGFAYFEAEPPEVRGISPTGGQAIVGDEFLFGGTVDSGSDGIPSDEFPAADLEDLEFTWEENGEEIRSGEPNEESGVDDAFEHVFEEAGTHTLSLTVEDPESGESDTLSKTNAYEIKPATLSGEVTHATFDDGLESEIYLDGEKKGESDENGAYEIEVTKAGERTLKIKKVGSNADGYKTYETTITIDDGTLKQDAELEAKPRDVTFVTQEAASVEGFDPIGDPVPEAELEIDGEVHEADEDGRIPLTLEAGTYDYEVEADGYETFEGEYEIEHGSGSSVTAIDLIKEDSGVLELDIVADGDSVGGAAYNLYVDGEELETNERGQALLEAGEHTLEVVGDGEEYGIVKRDVTIVEGKLTEETVDITSDVDADLDLVEYDTGEYETGESVSVTVELENTGKVEHTYFAGFSVRDEEGEYYDDEGTTGESVTVKPGETVTETLEWNVEPSVPSDEYDIVTTAWEESDRDSLETDLDTETAENAIEISGYGTLIDSFDEDFDGSSATTRGVGQAFAENGTRTYGMSGESRILLESAAGAGAAEAGTEGITSVGTTWEAPESGSYTVTSTYELEGELKHEHIGYPLTLEGSGAVTGIGSGIMVYDLTDDEEVDSEVVIESSARSPSTASGLTSAAVDVITFGKADVIGEKTGQISSSLASRYGSGTAGELAASISGQIAGELGTEVIVDEGVEYVFDDDRDIEVEHETRELSLNFEAEEGHEYMILHNTQGSTAAMGVAAGAAKGYVDAEADVDTLEITAERSEAEPPEVSVAEAPEEYINTSADDEVMFEVDSMGEASAESSFRVHTEDETTAWSGWIPVTESGLITHSPEEMSVPTDSEGEFIVETRVRTAESSVVSDSVSARFVVVEEPPTVELQATESDAGMIEIEAETESAAGVEFIETEYREDGKWNEWETMTDGEPLEVEDDGWTEVRARGTDTTAETGPWNTIELDDEDVLDPAQFDTSIDEAPSAVEAGEVIDVEATVENTGDIDGTSLVSLIVENETQATDDLSVAAGSSETKSFEYESRDDDPEDLSIEVVTETDSDAETVMLEAEPDPDPDPASFEVIGVESNAPVTVEDDLQITADLANVGERGAFQTIELKESDGTSLDSTGLDLDPDENKSVTLRVGTDEDDIGTRTLVASSENDSAEIDVEVHEGDDPEPAVELAVAEANEPVEGDDLEVEIELKNVGDAGATQTISLEVEGIGEDSTNLSLGKGDSTAQTLSVPTSEGDAGTYQVTAESKDDTDTAEVTIEPGDTSPNIQLANISGPAWDTIDGEQFTSEVIYIEPTDTDNLVLGGETEYLFEIQNTETNESVIMEPEVEEPVTLEEFGLSAYDGTGELSDDPVFGVITETGFESYPASVEGDETMFSEGDMFSEYQVRLLNSEYEVIDTTDERLIGTGYQGSIEQDTKTGEVTITLERNEAVDDDWNVRYLAEEGQAPFGDIIVEDTASIDEETGTFEFTVDVTDVDAGEYPDAVTIDQPTSEEDEFDWRDRILTITGTLDVEDTEEPPEPEVTIEHNPGSATSSTPIGDETRAYADQLDIFVETDDPVSFGGDADRALRVVNADTGESVTYDPVEGERTVPLDEMYRLGIQNEGTGEPQEAILPFPESDSEIEYENIDATVEGETGIFTDDPLGSYVIELLDEDGDVIDATDERLVGMGYEATFDQDGETATVTRDEAVEEDWYAEFWITGDDPELPPREEILDSVEVAHEDNDDVFEIPLDSLDVDEGEYDWSLILREDEDVEPDREQIVRISGGPNTDNGVVISDGPEINDIEVDTTLTNEAVTISADVEATNADVESVDLGVSADFTSFTVTEPADGDETTSTVEATIEADDVVADGEYTPTVEATDEFGNTVTETGDSVEFDTTPPEIQLRVDDLAEDDATMVLEGDEPFDLTDLEIEVDGNGTVDRTPEDSEIPDRLDDADDDLAVEFDGGSEGGDETTFTIMVEGVDDAGNDFTAEVESAIAGYEIEDGDAHVESDGVATSFDLSGNETEIGDETTREAVASESNTSPAGTELDDDLLAGGFLDVDDIGLGENELEEATIHVPVDALDEEVTDEFDAADLELLRSADGDSEYEPVDTEFDEDSNTLSAGIESFSQFAAAGTDDEPPEIDSIDVDPGTDVEPAEGPVTVHFEYSPVISDIDVGETEIDVTVADERVESQIDANSTLVQISDVEEGETITVELTLVDNAGNQLIESESVEVREDENGGNGGGNGGGGGGGGDGGGGGGGGGVPSTLIPSPPDDVAIVAEDDAVLSEAGDVSTVTFGDFLETTVLEKVTFENEELLAELRVRDFDKPPAEIGSPPGEPLATTELLGPDVIDGESAELQWNLENVDNEVVDLSEVDTDSLTVWSHTGTEWEPLETTHAEDVDDELVLTAEATEFAYFAITDADESDVSDEGETDDLPPEDTDDGESEADSEQIPGFGIPLAVIVIVGIAASLARRG